MSRLTPSQDAALEKLHFAVAECLDAGLMLQELVSQLKNAWVEVHRDRLHDAEAEARRVT